MLVFLTVNHDGGQTVTKYKELDSKNTQLTTPGDRVRYLRDALTKRGRTYFHDRYNISVDTLKSWENRKIPFRKKALDAILRLFHQEGVLVTESWLVEGKGSMPQLFSNLNQVLREPEAVYQNSKFDDHQLLIQEADYFKRLSKDSVIYQIISEEMTPWYSVHDYVGGRCKYGDHIKDTIGKDCIVKTQDNQIYFRRVLQGSKKGRYNLVCLNPTWDTSEPVIFNAVLEFSAPVVWHRKPES